MESIHLVNAAGVLITISAVFSYINHRWLRLPTTIGLMVMALAMSLAILLVGLFVPALADHARLLVRSIDFNQTLMHGMLGFLLFAGALHVGLDDLAQQKFLIALSATIGVVASTLVGSSAPDATSSAIVLAASAISARPP